MQRVCYNCGRDLGNEPAIRGLRGFTCFPCRYNFDKRGGEKFLLEHQSYQEKKEDWELKHKDKWVKCQRLKGFAWISLYLLVIFLLTPFFLFLFEKTNKIIPIFCFLISGAFFIIRMVLLKIKISSQEPPEIPRKEPNTLLAMLDVVFDGELDGEFLKFKGYPPDWKERQDKCLTRDGHKCRICGKTTRLHIHHIMPISFGGIHSLQNLITLCYACHKKQEYYQHPSLIMENIKANKRYWVSSHTRFGGKSIPGYFRKTGRRGGFWRRIRRVKSL
ncbi:MAG: HNH endonuclease [bacterium]